MYWVGMEGSWRFLTAWMMLWWGLFSYILLFRRSYLVSEDTCRPYNPMDLRLKAPKAGDRGDGIHAGSGDEILSPSSGCM